MFLIRIDEVFAVHTIVNLSSVSYICVKKQGKAAKYNSYRRKHCIGRETMTFLSLFHETFHELFICLLCVSHMWV